MNHVTGKENVLDFPEREIENKERSICVSGFFSIPNELADKLCSTRLSDQEHRVLFAVMRRTIGYRKLVDWVSLEQLHEMTDIKKPNLSKTIKTLLERRILIREGRKLGINPTVSEWVDKVRTLSKQITKVMPIDNDCYADRQPDHEQKVMPMDNAVIQTDNNCYADRQPQKNTILQNTDIKKETKKRLSNLQTKNHLPHLWTFQYLKASLQSRSQNSNGFEKPTEAVPLASVSLTSLRKNLFGRGNTDLHLMTA
ncbi:hypothetical protein TUMSATVNIG1_17970 [Vibrio nigripulchritudo]|uniref:replication protein n=1 Tax=Vibrio nigripulchritudo TaxID=28173 RepID=UPI002492C95F|nr:replication protein [Vibrio nigripulchritudo]BDU31188.1 hypothetical protein TUMSATVNIG1_17970 [Vibrio nigripulchritudo]